MSMVGRNMLRTVAGKRFFSATTASPKIAIAQNIMLMKEIAGATDEAALNKIAAAGLPKVDIANVPKELEEFDAYFSLSAMKSTEQFTADPKAWQNMGAWEFAGTELQRAETWPFFVGFVSVLVVLGCGIGASLPKSGDVRASSKYVQMLEGKKHDEHHH